MNKTDKMNEIITNIGNEVAELYEYAYNNGVNEDRSISERHAEYQVGFEKGFDEGAWTVWEWCEHYLVAKEDGGEIPVEELKSLFNVEHFGEILSNYEPFEAMAITDSYGLNVGDVGIINTDNQDHVVVIIRLNEYKNTTIIHGITRDGNILGCAKKHFKPLNKHVNLEEFFGDNEIWSVES